MAVDKKIEYRLKEVTRFIVTRFEMVGAEPPVVKQVGGEYANANVAYEVGYAVCKVEHEKLGWPVGDDRIIYPSQTVESEWPVGTWHAEVRSE